MVMNAIRRLSVVVDVEDQASAGLATIDAAADDTADSLSRAEAQMSALATRITVLGAAAGAGALAIGGLAYHGAQIDQIFARTKAMMGATAEEMGRIREAASRIGAIAPVTARETAETFKELAAAGFSVQESVAAAHDTVRLAVAGNLQMNEAAKITATSLQAFGLRAQQAGAVTEILANTAIESSAEVNTLGDALSYVSGTAAGAGQSLTETSAAIGVLADNSVEGSRAGTSLNQALSRLTDMSSEGQQALAQLGLSAESFVTEEGNFKDIADIALLLRDRFRELGITAARRTRMLQRMFGIRGARAMQPLIENAEVLQERVEAVSFAQIKQSIQELGGGQTIEEVVKNFRRRFEDQGLSQEELTAEIQAKLNVDHEAAQTLSEQLTSEKWRQTIDAIEAVSTAATISQEVMATLGGQVERLLGSLDSLAINLYRGFLPALQLIFKGLNAVGKVLSASPAAAKLFGMALFGVTTAFTVATLAAAKHWLALKRASMAQAVATTSTTNLTAAQYAYATAAGIVSKVQWALTASTGQLVAATWGYVTALWAKATAAWAATGGVAGLTSAVYALWTALGPLGWAVLAISGAFVAWETNLFGIRDKLSGVVGALGDFMDWLGGAADAVGRLASWVGALLNPMDMLTYLVKSLEAWFMGVRRAAKFLASKLDGLFRTLNEIPLLGDVARLLGKIGDNMDTLGDSSERAQRSGINSWLDYLREAARRGADAVGDLVTGFDDLDPSMQAALGSTQPWIPVVNDAVEVWGWLNDELEKFGGISGIIDSAIGWFRDLGTGTQFALASTNPLIAVLHDLHMVLSGDVDVMAEAKRRLHALTEWLGKASGPLSGLADHFRRFFRGLENWYERLTPLGQLIMGILIPPLGAEKAVEMLGKWLPGAADTASDHLSNLLDWMDKTDDATKDAVGGGLQDFLDWADRMDDKAKRLAAGGLDAFIDWVPGLRGVVDGFGDAVETLDRHLEPVREFFRNPWGTLTGGFTTALDVAHAALESAAEATITFFDVVDQRKGAWPAAAEAFETFITTFEDKTGIDLVPAGVERWLDIIERLRSLSLDGVIDGVADALRDRLGGAVAWVTEKLQGFEAWWQDLPWTIKSALGKVARFIHPMVGLAYTMAWLGEKVKTFIDNADGDILGHAAEQATDALATLRRVFEWVERKAAKVFRRVKKRVGAAVPSLDAVIEGIEDVASRLADLAAERFDLGAILDEFDLVETATTAVHDGIDWVAERLDEFASGNFSLRAYLREYDALADAFEWVTEKAEPLATAVETVIDWLERLQAMDLGDVLAWLKDTRLYQRFDKLVSRVEDFRDALSDVADLPFDINLQEVLSKLDFDISLSFDPAKALKNLNLGSKAKSTATDVLPTDQVERVLDLVEEIRSLSREDLQGMLSKAQQFIYTPIDKIAGRIEDVVAAFDTLTGYAPGDFASLKDALGVLTDTAGDLQDRVAGALDKLAGLAGFDTERFNPLKNAFSDLDSAVGDVVTEVTDLIEKTKEFLNLNDKAGEADQSWRSDDGGKSEEGAPDQPDAGESAPEDDDDGSDSGEGGPSGPPGPPTPGGERVGTGAPPGMLGMMGGLHPDALGPKGKRAHRTATARAQKRGQHVRRTGQRPPQSQGRTTAQAAGGRGTPFPRFIQPAAASATLGTPGVSKQQVASTLSRAQQQARSKAAEMARQARISQRSSARTSPLFSRWYKAVPAGSNPPGTFPVSVGSDGSLTIGGTSPSGTSGLSGSSSGMTDSLTGSSESGSASGSGSSASGSGGPTVNNTSNIEMTVNGTDEATAEQLKQEVRRAQEEGSQRAVERIVDGLRMATTGDSQSTTDGADATQDAAQRGSL